MIKKSKHEEKISKILTRWQIEFEFQKKFQDCIYKKPLLFDFYLPKYNCCIEFDGAHHFKPIQFKIYQSEMKANEEYKKQRIRDEIKNKFCKDNNIVLIRLNFKNYNRVIHKLKNKFDFGFHL
jgi:hypothetical protein